ncbi:uncharacterized protein LOC100891533 isoform X1 [Strongylocentrotus purpuratus]|uniref:Immunoglobulin subtype domain-containing protein n=1 Tax=Strongylocentrotus purpuratus TaxID=7668 RepID=A0A7M7NNQ2_STRPU|nr:uncharacterized protein LOC100891533 isoform X1 [Strongylocentrotus purpuratus]
MLSSEGIRISVVTFVILILSQDFIQVHSAATFIESQEGWATAEYSNVTLYCRVFISGGTSPHFSCATISFTKNETIIEENLKYLRSGPTFADNKVTCTMTILRVESEDSGLYGCCLTDKTTGSCYKHPTKMLNVISLPTTVQTTLEVTSTDAATSVSTTTLFTDNRVSSVGVTYNKVTASPENNSSLSKSENIARVQHTNDSLHKTIWPVLFVAALIIGILVLFGMRYLRKKRADESLPGSVTDVNVYHSIDSDKEVEKG